MSNEPAPKFDRHVLNQRLRAETSKFDKRELFITTGLAKPDRGTHAPREVVEEFRDFLTEWLDATEVKIPTTPGSVIVDHGDGIRHRPPRTYVLTPRSNTYLKDHEALRIPENVWSMVDGPGVPGWETADALTGYLSSGRAEVVYDAGADS